MILSGGKKTVEIKWLGFTLEEHRNMVLMKMLMKEEKGKKQIE